MSYEKVFHFIWKNIICRYGMPYSFITYHSTQFDYKEFKDYCECSKIQKLQYAYGHPHYNGQTKVMNKSLLDGMKKWRDDAKGNLINELQSVL